MEIANFLKFIQEKNQNSDIRKLSLQSISSINHQKLDKGIFQFEANSLHNQMPAYVNRKLKNLKPYTNHFKRFNIQTTKIQSSPSKKTQANKFYGIKQTQSMKIAKNQLLKQLGISQQKEDLKKVPEISVYQQFLQKTNSAFNNMLQNAQKTNSIKKNAKVKQQYKKQIRSVKKDKEIYINQRKSLGYEYKQIKTKQLQDRQYNNKAVKSMNYFPKNGQVYIKSQKVCIIPHITSPDRKFSNKQVPMKKNQQIFSSNKQENGIDKQSVAVQKKYFSTRNQKKTSIQENLKQRKSTLAQPYVQSNRTKQNESILTQQIKNFSEGIRKSQLLSQNKISLFKNDVSLKMPTQIQTQMNFKSFNFSLKKKIDKNLISTPISKTAKQQRQSKFKIQTSSEVQSFPLPNNITAFSYIVFQPNFSQNSKFKCSQDTLSATSKLFANNRILASLNCKSVQQIASLTKIMTCLLALQICDKLKIDSQKQTIRIGKFQSNINGTSAEIKQGQFYTIQQLYYGLMLPSGNDASLALATWGGKKMLINQIKEKERNKIKGKAENISSKILLQHQKNKQDQRLDENRIILKKRKCYERFILQMNKKARFLGMAKTTYANSHGLANNLNKSCAFDLCILCQYAMQNLKFLKIVSTIEYSCEIVFEKIKQDQQQNIPKKSHIKQDEQDNELNLQKFDDIEYMNEHSDEESIEQLQESETSQSKERLQQKKEIQLDKKQIKWQNTHKLLSKGEYIGIKTGITNTAGPCLASCIKTKQNRYFIIIVLNSKKLNNRFKDTQLLRKWIYRKQKIIKQKKSYLTNYDKLQVKQGKQEKSQTNEQQCFQSSSKNIT